jgi:thymidylate kinase
MKRPAKQRVANGSGRQRRVAELRRIGSRRRRSAPPRPPHARRACGQACGPAGPTRRATAGKLTKARLVTKLHFVAVLIAVWGASPGVGKSTLCAGLSAQLTAAGLRVDHFREEEILTRPQFAAVAEEFRATGTVELKTLLTATAQFVEAILAREDDVVIADALVPFVPSLLAWGHSHEGIAAFAADLAGVLAPVSLVLVYLDGTAGTALARAAQREGPQWLEGYIAKLARYKVSPPVSDLVSATRYLQRERAVTLAVARRQEWDLVLIEGATEMTPDRVLRTTQQELRRWMDLKHF